VSGRDAEDAVAAYTQFLGISDSARLGDRDAVASLPGLADGPVVSEIAAWRDQEQARTDSTGIPMSILSLANVSGTTPADASVVVIRDCLEVLREAEPQIYPPVKFVDQDVTMRRADGDGGGGGWIVARVDIVHSGRFDAADRFGCIPERHRQRVEETVLSFLTYQEQMERDPNLDRLADLSALAEAFALEEVTKRFGPTPRDRFVVSPANYRVGLSSTDAAVGGYRFLVGVCEAVPDGKIWEWVDDGQHVVEEPLTEGNVIFYYVGVRSEPTGNGFSDKVFEISDPEYPSRCWDRLGDKEVLSWR
jgi:hypothetical protein